ncbi:hypothetical protein MNR01_02135 [Lysobacter sp. S4-A87]|uniref:hypothetical protein n=1 Tax=Lysobacter sp. S4-A87 TaxID=2925843 RepID=UPI001F53893F|nr:hypothetical protein [Lysobacter sp. S4-A87]UNK51263.1 hypothetical protein MNR01_02135 [Lysobacter sp. S4-A87]
MHLLATPGVKGRIRGLALVDTAPDSGWHAEYVEMTRNRPLPGFDASLEEYERNRSID